MNVLVVSHKYPPSVGGMQKHCFELVHGIRKHCKVTTVIYNNKYPKIFFLISAVLITLWKVRKHKVNVIYINDGLMAVFMTPILFLTKTPVVATIHGLDIVFSLKAYQWWVKKYLTKFNGIIAVSEGTREECIKRGINTEKVVCIKNGFDPTFKKLDIETTNFLDKKWTQLFKGKDVLVSVGRPIKRKGFSWFIKNVLTRLPKNTLYVIIGPKPQKSLFLTILKSILPKKFFHKLVLAIGIPEDEFEIQKSVSDLGYENRIVRTGHVSKEELSYLLRKSDLYVMPNISVKGDYEGFGLVSLEAAREGALVLASNIEGITSAIQHKKNGLLIESGASSDWITTISTLLKNKTEIVKTRQEYTKYAISYSQNWDMMSQDYFKYLSKISMFHDRGN